VPKTADPIAPRLRVVAAVACDYKARERSPDGELVEVRRIARRRDEILLDPVQEMILSQNGALAAPGSTPEQVEAEVAAKITAFEAEHQQLPDGFESF
jgi:hypothetical protein